MIVGLRLNIYAQRGLVRVGVLKTAWCVAINKGWQVKNVIVVWLHRSVLLREGFRKSLPYQFIVTVRGRPSPCQSGPHGLFRIIQTEKTNYGRRPLYDDVISFDVTGTALNGVTTDYVSKEVIADPRLESVNELHDSLMTLTSSAASCCITAYKEESTELSP